MDRNVVIKAIKTDLKRRSGRSWSVSGGTGSAYGWITIDALPAKRTARWELKAGEPDYPGNYIEVETGLPGGHITPTDQKTLAKLLGIESVHHQGVQIAASNAHYEEYLDRAAGRTPRRVGEQYWD